MILLRRGLFLVAALGLLAYGGAMVVTLADIFARPLGLAVPGVVDLVQLFVLTGAYLAIPYAFLEDGHVSVDLFVKRFPHGFQVGLKVFSALAALALLTPMLFEVIATAKIQAGFGDRSQQLGIPKIWYWVPLIAGVGFSLLATLALARKHLQEKGPR